MTLECMVCTRLKNSNSGMFISPRGFLMRDLEENHCLSIS